MEWREGESEKEIHRGDAEGVEGEIGSRRREDAKHSFLSMESRGADWRRQWLRRPAWCGSGVPPDEEL